ncbi:MAG: hypothetical protein FWG58_02100 [Methanomassiliicoccaceae archaeon]|nr:hypothetical protein [Methanomassiliicoccaceae archaeon]
MNNSERAERLNELLDELSEMCTERILLVEGTKDKWAISLLGVNAEMIAVQAEGGPLRTAERLFNEKRGAIIMTDWDPKGEEIAKELEHHLSSLCVGYDMSIRAKIRSVCAGEIHDVESLPSFYSRIATISIHTASGCVD